ncbi:MAG: MFS transporter [Pseudomonadota bacterium]
MIGVFTSSWALFLGLFLLMIGNGMQGTLLGIRGAIEGFSAVEMSYVMSGYFLGFLGGARLAPYMIRRVGHIRVFAALASFISAILILYPTFTEVWAWATLRILFGFCFSGLYVVAESWLNNAASNETRGQSLSIYSIVIMAGVVASQFLVTQGDPSGFVLFILPSVLVSIAVAPVLLSVTPTPAFETTKPMGVIEAFRFSPLSAVGAFCIGGVFAAQFGMTAVYGTEAGLSTSQIAVFVAAFYVGGLVFQGPVGWVSDRVDRRLLIMLLALGAGAAAIGAFVFAAVFPALVAMCFLIGGLSNPLYPLIIAYMNDYLPVEDMAAGSGALIFLNGLGAVTGPVLAGYMMTVFGPPMFWVFIAAIMLALGFYAVWRSGRRPVETTTDDNVTYAPFSPAATAVAIEAAQEMYVENVETAEETTAEAEASAQ